MLLGALKAVREKKKCQKTKDRRFGRWMERGHRHLLRCYKKMLHARISTHNAERGFSE